MLLFLYSVMQSDGNSFCGDVILDSFNMANSDEDSILDKKICKAIILLTLLKRFWIFRVIDKYAFLNKYST